MPLTLLLPKFTHPAIEERYAAWQNRVLLQRAAPGTAVIEYDPSRSAGEVLRGIETSQVLVVTHPLFVAGREIVTLLSTALDRHPEAFAALPVANQSAHPAQQRSPDVPYLTLRQFQEQASAVAASGTSKSQLVDWDTSDPAVYLARTAGLSASGSTLSGALKGRRVAIASQAYIHRYSSHRGQLRSDLLDRIPVTARSILEFGCGEAALGAALKARQACRVVGVELDPEAAAIARHRLDAVHGGDVRTLVRTLGERFDWIVGGDILEHLDEPWSFLSELRRLAAPGGHLLLSLPNVASWPIVADLLRGRFDYVYMGILCAGHLRFFTRPMIEEMLEIAGWQVVAIEPQEAFSTAEGEALRRKLREAEIPHSEQDLVTPGFYVIARNDVTGL